MENKNAIEAWALYDSVLVGEGMAAKSGAGWYDTFSDLANETEIGFFNQRNRAVVGVPYTSLDTSEQIPFAFRATSIGLDVYVPPFSDIDPANDGSLGIPRYHHFLELLRHASFRLVISQDEKLLTNALAVPGGAGVSGYFNEYTNSPPFQASATYSGIGNGDPCKSVRWAFPEPISIPRNRNLAAWIQFSNHARAQMRVMGGPGRVRINPAFLDPQTQLPTYQSTTVPGVVIMRVSINGFREVQQRNELRFA